MKFSAQNSAFLSTKKETVGFTLIELLVVVSLVTIMTGALVPSLTSYIDDQNLKQAQENVKNELRSVQNKALAGSLSDNLSVAYWGIRFTGDSNIYESLTSSNVSCTTPSNLSNREGLTSNIVIKRGSGTSPYCVLFSVANGDRSSAANTSNVYVGKSSAAAGSVNCRSITIQDNGLIFASSAKVACPN